MSLTRNEPRKVAAMVLAVVAATAATAARAQESADYEKLLNDKKSTLVTIKFVLKVNMGPMMGGDQESESEITGVMIDPHGLILCSNTQLGGFAGMMKRMMGGMFGNITATPKDLKVLVGEEDEELDAELLARDTELDLAWVKIKEPPNKALDHVDFAKGLKPKIGQRVVAIRRLGKFFGRATAVVDGHIGGITTKPRDLYIPSGNFGAAMGLPVYAPDGRVVGVTVLQAPDEEDAEVNPMLMLSRMSNLQEMFGGLILPAADVAKATKRAMQSIEAEQQQ